MSRNQTSASSPFFLCFAGMGFCFAWKGLVGDGTAAVDDAVVRLAVPCAAAFAWRLLTPAVRGRWLIGCTGVAALVGTLLAWGSACGAGSFCHQAGSALITAGNLLMLLYWTEFYALLRAPRLVFVLASAYLAGPLLYFAVKMIPDVFAPGFAAVFPLASAACLCASLALVCPEGGLRTFSFAAERSNSVTVDRMRENQRKTGYPWQPVAVVAAYAFAFGINRNYTTNEIDLASQAMAGLALLLMAACAKRFSVHHIIQMALPLIMVGLLLGVLFGGTHPAAQVLINACYAFSAVSLIVLLCNRAHRFDISAIWLNGFARTATGAAFLAGMSAERMAENCFESSAEAAQVVYGITLVVVVLATFFWFAYARANDLSGVAYEASDEMAEAPRGNCHIEQGESLHVSEHEQGEEAEACGGAVIPPTKHSDSVGNGESKLWLSLVRARCDELASEYRLSRRETEVLELLARGRSAPRIEQELVLSNSTVKTHIRHIYSKLDIHSRDELKILLAIE